MIDTINTDYLNRTAQNGFVLSFENDALSLKKDDGVLSAWPTAQERAAFGAPVTLASFIDLGQGPDIAHPNFTIKKKNSWDIALPTSHTFALPIAKVVGDDALTLYGAQRFHAAEIMFVAARTNIDTGRGQHCEAIQKWHNHRANHYIDMLYGFYDHLPTEFRKAGEVKSGSPNSLIRHGTDEEHRATINDGPSLRRTWGAFMICLKGNRMINPKRHFAEPYNTVLNQSDKISAFKAAAASELFQNKIGLVRNAAPEPLFN